MIYTYNNCGRDNDVSVRIIRPGIVSIVRTDDDADDWDPAIVSIRAWLLVRRALRIQHDDIVAAYDIIDDWPYINSTIALQIADIFDLMLA